MEPSDMDIEPMVNDADSYAVYSNELKLYEVEFEHNPSVALMKMTELFVKLQDTCFHDLYDSICLWIDRYGDQNLLDYIVESNNPKLILLRKTIEQNISH